MSRYNFKDIEKKWHHQWSAASSVASNVPKDTHKKKFYVLEMFPYPSGRIHMGHVRNYALGDLVSRFKKVQGYEVMHPMGWDAFGLPAENAARERGLHPEGWTYSNIESMKAPLQQLGFAYDWSREIATCHPNYYRHQQKLFLDFYKAGLVYQKESYVNWDPAEETVLANEQVIEGRGWRSGALVERRLLRQWFVNTSLFQEELLKNLDDLTGWPSRVVLMQKNWIGYSEGARVRFSFADNPTDAIEVFTTRPDTLFGASFIGISPDHPLAQKLEKDSTEVATFLAQCRQIGTSQEALDRAEKVGLDTGLKVVNPLNPSQQLPVWIANFVLMDYGTGAIFGCPAHDARDHEFATKYNLPIYPVITVPEGASLPYTGEGLLSNS